MERDRRDLDLEDFHGFTWGSIGYNHLDAAEKQGKAVLDAALRFLTERIDSRGARPSGLSVTVFNPHAWDHSGVVLTGRIRPPREARDVAVLHRSGRPVPSQLVNEHRDEQGNLVVVEVAFEAREVPSAGYDTYHLEFTPAVVLAPATDLRVDEPALLLENDRVRVGLDPATGAVASIVHKGTGREVLAGKQGAFPRFTGRPNPNLSLRPEPPASYDSAGSQAAIDWVERGPLRATVRAQHRWKYLTFETRVPPHSDRSPPDIEEGYWFSLATAFESAAVVRDYPLAVEPTEKSAFHALTFADLVGKDLGLLVLHAGTQYFKRREGGILSNLAMREWESHFTREYGWPVYVEYRHGLLPHAGNLKNSDRLRAAAAFARPMLVALGPPRPGDLPPAESFITVSPRSVRLSAFRTKAGSGYELRVVECEGRAAEAAVELALPLTEAVETDLLGRKVRDAGLAGGRLAFRIRPWKIRTFALAGRDSP